MAFDHITNLDDRAATTGADRLARRVRQLRAVVDAGTACETRLRLSAQILERLTLLRRMLDRMAIDLAAAPPTSPLLREAEAHCLGCAATAACRAWLDDPVDWPGHPVFCANGATFARLRAADAPRRP